MWSSYRVSGHESVAGMYDAQSAETLKIPFTRNAEETYIFSWTPTITVRRRAIASCFPSIITGWWSTREGGHVFLTTALFPLVYGLLEDIENVYGNVSELVVTSVFVVANVLASLNYGAPAPPAPPARAFYFRLT